MQPSGESQLGIMYVMIFLHRGVDCGLVMGLAICLVLSSM